jgi:hypothetical protein
VALPFFHLRVSKGKQRRRRRRRRSIIIVIIIIMETQIFHDAKIIIFKKYSKKKLKSFKIL